MRMDGLAFAAGMARVAGTMMVFPSLRLIVVVEDGGSLVLWKVLAAVVWLSARASRRAREHGVVHSMISASHAGSS